VRLEVDALVIRKLVEEPVVAKSVPEVAFVKFALEIVPEAEVKSVIFALLIVEVAIVEVPVTTN
jgi:hypothetical protein